VERPSVSAPTPKMKLVPSQIKRKIGARRSTNTWRRLAAGIDSISGESGKQTYK
jgi:hypothetical protein